MSDNPDDLPTARCAKCGALIALGIDFRKHQLFRFDLPPSETGKYHMNPDLWMDNLASYGTPHRYNLHECAPSDQAHKPPISHDILGQPVEAVVFQPLPGEDA